jgi:hypothetical protein
MPPFLFLRFQDRSAFQLVQNVHEQRAVALLLSNVRHESMPLVFSAQ